MEGMHLVGRVLQGTSDSRRRSQGALEGTHNYCQECINSKVRACHWGLLSPWRLPVTSKQKAQADTWTMQASGWCSSSKAVLQLTCRCRPSQWSI